MIKTIIATAVLAAGVVSIPAPAPAATCGSATPAVTIFGGKGAQEVMISEQAVRCGTLRKVRLVLSPTHGHIDCHHHPYFDVNPSPWGGKDLPTRRLYCTSTGAHTRWTEWASGSRDTSLYSSVHVRDTGLSRDFTVYTATGRL